jgi:hypothetical protein
MAAAVVLALLVIMVFLTGNQVTVVLAFLLQ